jgi:hypothetical protein
VVNTVIEIEDRRTSVGPGAFTRLAAADDIRFYLQQRWAAAT